MEQSKNSISFDMINNKSCDAFCSGCYRDKVNRSIYGPNRANRYAYSIVFINSINKNVSSMSNFGYNHTYPESDDIVGEVYAIIHAIEWALSNNYSKITIHHDHEEINKWVTELNTEKNIATMIHTIYKTKFAGLIEIEFESTSHKNEFQQKADQLAIDALTHRLKISNADTIQILIETLNVERLKKLCDRVKNEYEYVKILKANTSAKEYTIFILDGQKVVLSKKTYSDKALFRSKNTLLSQMILTLLFEIDPMINMDALLKSICELAGDAYKIKQKYNSYFPKVSNLGLPFPTSLKNMIHLSIANMNVNSKETCAQLAFPALYALNKYLKIEVVLIDKAPITQVQREMKQKQLVLCRAYLNEQTNRYFNQGHLTVEGQSIQKLEANEMIETCIKIISSLYYCKELPYDL